MQEKQMHTKFLYAAFRKNGNTGNLKGSVFEVAPSSDNDVNRYVSTRRLLDSNFNIQQEPESPELVLFLP